MCCGFVCLGLVWACTHHRMRVGSAGSPHRVGCRGWMWMALRRRCNLLKMGVSPHHQMRSGKPDWDRCIQTQIEAPTLIRKPMSMHSDRDQMPCHIPVTCAGDALSTPRYMLQITSHRGTRMLPRIASAHRRERPGALPACCPRASQCSNAGMCGIPRRWPAPCGIRGGGRPRRRIGRRIPDHGTRRRPT